MGVQQFGTLLAVLMTATTLGAGTERSLIDAVKSGDAAAVRVLLKQGADVNTPAGDGTTPLHWASYKGDLAATEVILAARPNVNATTDLGITPLWLAATSGNADVVVRLLKAGADPNISPPTGGTPLMRASRGGHAAAVRLLVTHGADVNAKESAHGQTALMWAVSRQHPAVVKVLLDAGADVRAKAKIWREVVQMCCWAQTSEASDITEIDRGGYTPLLFAARQGDVESARWLLAAGANVNETSAEGATPLAIAAFSAHQALVAFLVENGADPNVPSGGYTPLHAAVLRGNIESVKALLAHGANPNGRLTGATTFTRGRSDYQFHKNWIGATPFWLAAAFHDAEFMRILVAAGADPQLPQKNGSTPLMAAAAGEKRRTNYEGGPQLPSAEEEQKALETVTMLVREFHADVHAANDRGDTAVHRAADRRVNTVIEFLALNGASVNVQNKRGQTPVALVNSCPRCEVGGSFILDAELAAAARGREGTLAVLRKMGAKD